MIFFHTPFSRIRDFFGFQKITAERQARFDKASADFPLPPKGVNTLEKRMHPQTLSAQFIEKETTQSGTLLSFSAKDGVFPVFRAGQFVNILFNNRYFPFFIADTVQNVLAGRLTVYVPFDTSDEVNNAIGALKQNDTVILSAPVGYFYYVPLRDGKTVLFLCDESGLGAATAFAEEQNAEEKVVYCVGEKILSNKKIQSAQLKDIDFSTASTVFVCGKKAFCEGVIAKAQSEKIRRCYTDCTLLCDAPAETFTLTVLFPNRKMTFSCTSDRPLIDALEQANLGIPNKCLSGDCSFCRAKLVSGKVKPLYPDGVDTRRDADIKYGFIHPCICYPLSDVTLAY